MKHLFVIVLAIALAAPSAMAQDDVEGPLAVFEAARALGVDPLGRLYVVDAGPSVIYQLEASGEQIASVGAGGLRDHALIEPADVDPTNGLLMLVADAGSGRIHRYSRSFAYRGALEAGDSGGRPNARPVSVASTSTNAVYAIDDDAGVVLKWDESQQFSRTVGGFSDGSGALVRPVALATDADDYLYVADAEIGGIMVYDSFGSFARHVAQGVSEDVRALTVHGGRLWIMLPRQVLGFSMQGRREVSIGVTLEEELVDAAWLGGDLFLLTSTGLFVMRAANGDAPTLPGGPAGSRK